MSDRLAPRLFPLDPGIRDVAVNQPGKITEMEQRAERPSHNPPESDLIQELIVNPVVLEATRRRGNLDFDAVRHVIIHYGKQYQAPVRRGHVSVGVESSAGVAETVNRVSEALAATAAARP